MRIFRGYIPCNEDKTPKNYYNPRTKHSICKRKGISDEELLTKEEIDHFPNFAGLLSEEPIIIDVDNQKESLLLFNLVKDLQINCKVIQTTKGKHFYFKKPDDFPIIKQRIKTLLRIGIEADCLFGSERYVILKQNNKVRETIYETKEIEELPYWLYPIPKSEAAKRFSEVYKGERDNSLLAYQVVLANQGLNEAEIKETIKIINKYIMPEPVSDEDIERITRTEVVQGAKEIVKDNKNSVLSRFINNKKILYDEYAKHLIDKLGIIKKNGFLYVFKDGIYVINTKELNYISNYIANEEFPNLTNGKHADILSAINRQIVTNTNEAPNGFIPLQNGFVVLDEFNPITGEFPLHDHQKDVIFTQFSPVDYNPNADDSFVKEVMMTYACNRDDLFQLLCEMVGYMFLRGVINFQAKCFIITGSQNNGKTTFLNVLEALVGENNRSNISPQDFGDRFTLSTMENKLVNIVNDLDEEAIESSGKFKEVVDGTSIKAERKGEQAYSFKPYATQIFACNNIPRIKDDSPATRKRLFIIPFDKEFKKEDMKYDIEAMMKQPQNLSALLNLGLKAIKGVIDRSHFTKCEVVEEMTKKYASSFSQILGFIEDCEENEYVFEGKTVKEVYERYNNYCIEYSFKNTFNPINFSMKLCKSAKLETIVKRNGFRTERIYTKV